MDLVIGRGEWRRKRGSPVPWRQENCLLEQIKTDPKGWNILSRPPLVSYASIGTGPIEGEFQKPGLFNGDKFYVSNGTLYRGAVSIGSLDGSGEVIWAAGIEEIVITRGQSAWSYNGTNLAAVAFPDGANVNSVNWMARRFIYARKGSGRFYWSALDDGRTIDGLDFANAESEPDELLDIAKMGDLFAMLGANSVETWTLNGDPDLPWTRVSQRTFGRGIFNPGAKAEIPDANTIYFISSDSMVCKMAGDAPQRVSDSALEEDIKLASHASVFAYQFEGKPYVVLRLEDVATYVLDLANGDMPSRFSTQRRGNWAPLCAMTIAGVPYFGDDSSSSVWTFSEGAVTDSGQPEMPRYFSAGLPSSTNLSVFNIVVDGNNGSATVETGESAEPILEMRYSRDGGRNFSDWRGTSWGRMGQSKRRARFGACGSFSQPGFLAEFRMLACAPLRVERAGLNENLSGRAVGSYRAPSVPPPPPPPGTGGQLDFSSSINSALLLLLDDI
jgi:hypothetical protein